MDISANTNTKAETLASLESLGDAVEPVLALIKLLQEENEHTAPREKIEHLKLLEKKWRSKFVNIPSPEATHGASAVVGIVVHVISTSMFAASVEGSLGETGLRTLATILEGCETFSKFLPAIGGLRVLSMISMYFPSEGAECTFSRTEEGIDSALGCISSFLQCRHYETESDINWLCTPKMHTPNEWVYSLSLLMVQTEQGRNTLAQLVFAMLLIGNGGEGTGWPAGKLPRSISLAALHILDTLLNLLSDQSNSSLWRSFIPGISSQLFKVITRGSIAPTTNSMGSIVTAVSSAKSAGVIGTEHGFSNVADSTRRKVATSSKVVALALTTLTRALTLLCCDDKNNSCLPLESNELSNMMGGLCRAENQPCSRDETAIAWRNQFLDRIRVVIDGSMTVARRHTSWRVKMAAVTSCELLLRTCRRFLGVDIVVVLMESLAVISQTTMETNNSNLISPVVALQRLHSACGAWEWRQVLVVVQSRLDRLVSSFKAHGRVAGQKITDLTDSLQLSTGLLHLLSLNKVKGPPLPLIALCDAISGLMTPDKGAAVLVHSQGVAFFRRSVVHLDEPSSKMVSELLSAMGYEARRAGSLVSLIAHSARDIEDYAQSATINTEGEENLGVSDRAWWAEKFEGCSRSFASVTTLNLALRGAMQSGEASSHLIQICHHLVHVLIGDDVWQALLEGHGGHYEQDAQVNPETVVSRSENGINMHVQQRKEKADEWKVLGSTWREAVAWVIAARLECLGVISALLGESFLDEGLLMACLYPVLCKATDPHPAVRQAAVSAVTMFATYTLGAGEHEDRVNMLLCDHLDYIVDAFCEDLQALHSGRIISVTTTTHLAVLEFLLQSSGTTASAPLLRDVLSAVLREVDRSTSCQPPAPVDALLALVSCLNSLVNAVSDDFDDKRTIDVEFDTQFSDTACRDQINYMALLVQSLEKDVDTSEETFEKVKSLDEIEQIMLQDPSKEVNEQDLEKDDDEEEKEAIVPPDVQLLIDLLPRLGYLWRSPHPQVQVASVYCLDAVIRKLRLRRRILLPAVHKTWPALITALQPRSSPNKPAEIDIPLAAAACKLMSTLTEVTGDFMSFKFVEDLWPAVRGLLQSLGSKVVAPISSGSSVKYERLDDRRLRLSLLNCCHTLAKNHSCRRFVIPVTSELINLALPFLTSNDAVHEEAMSLCSTLIIINPDAAWSTLWSQLTPHDASSYARALLEKRIGRLRTTLDTVILPTTPHRQKSQQKPSPALTEKILALLNDLDLVL